MYFFETTEYWGLYENIPAFSDELASPERFLSPEERERYESFRNERSRRSWSAGRLAFKRLWHRVSFDGSGTGVSWQELAIRSRNSEGKGIRPTLFVSGNPVEAALSISHSDEAVLVVLAKDSRLALGCDLTPLGSVGVSMMHAFFLPDERKIAADSDYADRYWAVKEAAYKAGNSGLPFAPKRWRILDTPRSSASAAEGVFACRNEIELPDGANTFSIRTFLHDSHVLAVATPSVEHY